MPSNTADLPLYDSVEPITNRFAELGFAKLGTLQLLYGGKALLSDYGAMSP
ncbi:MAG: hypothetical protein WBA99_08910 [Nodosilinea sp.]